MPRMEEITLSNLTKSYLLMYKPHKYRYFRLVVLLLLITFLGDITPISAIPSTQDTSNPAYPFGVVGGYWRPDDTTDLGVSWEIFTFDWAKIQPNGPSDFDLSTAQTEWITSATANQREVVGMVVNTPTWASPRGASTAVPDGLYNRFDDPENYWAVFLRQLVTEFSALGIHRWIIWDNPDITAQDNAPFYMFDGTVADYYRLMKVAYQSIRSVDNTAQVYIGALGWWGDIVAGRELFLKRFLSLVQEDTTAETNNQFFDGLLLDIRISPETLGGIAASTDSVGDIPTTVQQILQEGGFPQKEIWVMIGLTPTLDSSGGLPSSFLQFTPQQQADFIVQGIALALAAGAERIAVYKLFDSNFEADVTVPYGLIRFDNSRRPAFQSYASIIPLFANTQKITVGRSQNARLVVMEQTNRTVYVMWTAATQAVNFWVERRFQDDLVVYDVLGNTLPPPRPSIGVENIDVHVITTRIGIPNANDTIQVGGSPVILVMDDSPREVWAAIGTNALRIYPNP